VERGTSGACARPRFSEAAGEKRGRAGGTRAPLLAPASTPEVARLRPPVRQLHISPAGRKEDVPLAGGRYLSSDHLALGVLRRLVGNGFGGLGPEKRLVVVGRDRLVGERVEVAERVEHLGESMR